MDNLYTVKLPALNFFCIVGRNPARELSSVQITNSNDLTFLKFPLAPSHARRQQTFSALTQGPLRAIVHKHGPLGMVKKSYPPFASLELCRLRNKQRPFVFSAQNPGQSVPFSSRRNHQ